MEMFKTKVEFDTIFKYLISETNEILRLREDGRNRLSKFLTVIILRIYVLPPFFRFLFWAATVSHNADWNRFFKQWAPGGYSNGLDNCLPPSTNHSECHLHLPYSNWRDSTLLLPYSKLLLVEQISKHWIQQLKNLIYRCLLQ